MANILLLKRDTIFFSTTIEKKWVYNFTRYISKLKIYFVRCYNYQRAKIKDFKVLDTQFKQINKTIQKYSIVLSDIYNFNKTGFIIDLIAIAKVITRFNILGKLFLLQLENWEQITTIEYINSNKQTLSFYIIFKDKIYIKAWYKNNKISFN